MNLDLNVIDNINTLVTSKKLELVRIAQYLALYCAFIIFLSKMTIHTIVYDHSCNSNLQ